MCYCQYKSKRKKHAVRAIGVSEDGEIGLNRLKMICNYLENHSEQNLNLFAFKGFCTNFIPFSHCFQISPAMNSYSGEDLKLNYKRLHSYTALWIQWPKNYFNKALILIIPSLGETFSSRKETYFLKIPSDHYLVKGHTRWKNVLQFSVPMETVFCQPWVLPITD